MNGLEAWLVTYILIATTALYLVVLAIAGCTWVLLKAAVAGYRTIRRRRDARLARHVERALQARPIRPPGSPDTQVLARYETELADLNQYYLHPEDFR